VTRDRRLTIAPSRPYDFIDVSAGHNCNATYGPAAVAPRPVRGQSGRAVGRALSQQAPELAFCTLPPLFVPLLLKPVMRRIAAMTPDCSANGHVALVWRRSFPDIVSRRCDLAGSVWRRAGRRCRGYGRFPDTGEQ
jgi:hypothetical protein